MIRPAVAATLRGWGYDVVSVHELGLGNRRVPDEAILEFAANSGRAVLTFNVREYLPLDDAWRVVGREHAGIICSGEISAVGELARRLVAYLDSIEPAIQWNTVVWL
ncbi:MAG: DUF5615 family PIN-like protein [Chloroflexi bacterium]|nr:DUF5615 family PIN-like protein [Chloroflexota bacterium]